MPARFLRISAPLSALLAWEYCASYFHASSGFFLHWAFDWGIEATTLVTLGNRIFFTISTRFQQSSYEAFSRFVPAFRMRRRTGGRHWKQARKAFFQAVVVGGGLHSAPSSRRREYFSRREACLSTLETVSEATHRVSQTVSSQPQPPALTAHFPRPFTYEEVWGCFLCFTTRELKMRQEMRE